MFTRVGQTKTVNCASGSANFRPGKQCIYYFVNFTLKYQHLFRFAHFLFIINLFYFIIKSNFSKNVLQWCSASTSLPLAILTKLLLGTFDSPVLPKEKRCCRLFNIQHFCCYFSQFLKGVAKPVHYTSASSAISSEATVSADI